MFSLGLFSLCMSCMLPWYLSRWFFSVGAVFVGGKTITLYYPNYTFVGGEGVMMEPTFILLLVALMIAFVMSSRRKYDLYAPLLFLCCLSVFTSTSKWVFFIGFETAVFLTGVLMLQVGSNPERLSAFFYFMVMTLVGSFPLLVYVALSENKEIFRGAAVMDLSIVLCLLLPLVMKVPAYGVHKWLPKAHVESDVSGSIILAGVLMKLGSYGMIRFSQHWGILFSGGFSYVVMVMMVLGMTVAGVVTLRQNDMKAYVANSSVLHVATSLVIILYPSTSVTQGVASIAFSHAIVAGVLFMFAHYVYSMNNTRNIQIASMPSNFRTLFFFYLTLNSAIPGTLFSVAEMMMFQGVAVQGLVGVICVYVLLKGLLSGWLYMVMSRENDYSFEHAFSVALVVVVIGGGIYLVVGYLF